MMTPKIECEHPRITKQQRRDDYYQHGHRYDIHSMAGRQPNDTASTPVSTTWGVDYLRTGFFALLLRYQK